MPLPALFLAPKVAIGIKGLFGAKAASGAIAAGAAAKGGIAAIGGMLMKGVGTTATVASSGVSAAASVAKLGLKAAMISAGLIGGSIKCGLYLNERRKAKKKAKTEEREREEALKRGVVLNYAYQSHYGLPKPNAPQGQPPPQEVFTAQSLGKKPTEGKNKEGSLGLSTVFDKRDDAERRKAGGYIEGDQIPNESGKIKFEEKTKLEDKKSVKETYDSLTKRSVKSTTKTIDSETKPSTIYKELNTPSQTPIKQSLGHDMEIIKAEVEVDKQAREDVIYKHHRQALIDKCNNDLEKIKADYQTAKAMYKWAEKNAITRFLHSHDQKEKMEKLAKKFEDRQMKLEKALAELDVKHNKT